MPRFNVQFLGRTRGSSEGVMTVATVEADDDRTAKLALYRDLPVGVYDYVEIVQVTELHEVRREWSMNRGLFLVLVLAFVVLVVALTSPVYRS